MNLRAAIFDVYGTVLAVTPPPADAALRWAALWRTLLGREPRLSLADFHAACQGVVARDHAAARTAGIPWPEVFWPDVVREVVPELRPQISAVRDEFIFQHASLTHTVQLMPGSADVLRALRRAGVLLGIASNAQPYTLRELAEALAVEGLAPDLFAPDLCCWSFAHGFSKPDPHVFRLLTARLRALDVTPAETLMVGDRADNDIAPARAQGWRTWQLSVEVQSDRIDAGDWRALATLLAAHATGR